MPSTTVKVKRTILVDVEVEHKFRPGDVVFPILTPEERDEKIIGVYQYVTTGGTPTDGLMYRFEPRPGGSPYGRSSAWVDKHYMKARP